MVLALNAIWHTLVKMHFACMHGKHLWCKMQCILVNVDPNHAFLGENQAKFWFLPCISMTSSKIFVPCMHFACKKPLSMHFACMQLCIAYMQCIQCNNHVLKPFLRKETPFIQHFFEKLKSEKNRNIFEHSFC